MVFSDFLKPYEEIEPMPEPPKMPSWRPVWFTWAIVAIVTALFTDTTHATVNLIWIPWLIIMPWARVHSVMRASRKFDRDLDEWSARADAHHERVMRQIQQYAKRDWN